MRRWDVFFGSHFLGVVRADDEKSALEAAYEAFGQHMRGALVVKGRGSWANASSLDQMSSGRWFGRQVWPVAAAPFDVEIRGFVQVAREYTPPINEAVGLLSKFSPSVLASLQKQLPELGPHLEPGGFAGPADPQIIARATVCLQTLAEVKRICNRGISYFEKRLSLQMRFVLIGGMTTTVASASVVVFLVTEYSTIAFVLGVVSLVGALATLLSKHVGKVPKSGVTLFDAYQQLVGLRTDAHILQGDLERRLNNNPKDEDEQEISRLIGKRNKLFSEAYETLLLLKIASEQSND